MKDRNLIIVLNADQLRDAKAWLRVALDTPRAENTAPPAAVRDLLRALDNVRDGGLLTGTPYEEKPEAPPEGKGEPEKPADAPPDAHVGEKGRGRA